jgi:hypothetical protein
MQNSEACYLKEKVKGNSRIKDNRFQQSQISLFLEITAVFHVCQPTGTHQMTFAESPQVLAGCTMAAKHMGSLFWDLPFKQGFTMRAAENPTW